MEQTTRTARQRVFASGDCIDDLVKEVWLPQQMNAHESSSSLSVATITAKCSTRGGADALIVMGIEKDIKQARSRHIPAINIPVFSIPAIYLIPKNVTGIFIAGILRNRDRLLK